MEPISLNSDWIELLHGLNAASIKFLIVGAHAFARYSTPRATGDLDIWIERSKQNAEKTYRVVTDFGAPLGELTVDDLQSDDIVFMFGTPPMRVDILTGIDGVAFAEAWETRVEGELGGIPVAFIGREKFLQNKRAAGRPKDLADVAALEKPGDRNRVLTRRSFR